MTKPHEIIGVVGGSYLHVGGVVIDIDDHSSGFTGLSRFNGYKILL